MSGSGPNLYTYGMIGDKPIVDLPQAVRGLIEARTGDAVFVVAPDFRIVHWDEQTEFLTGIAAEEALGKCCYEVVLGEREGGIPFCSYGCSVMKLAQAGRPVASYDMRLSTPFDGERWVNVSILSVDSEAGPYLIHLLRDAQQAHEALELARGLIQLSRKDDLENPPVPRPRSVPALTPRQLEVLGLLSRGRSTREISRDLFLSEPTVRNHVQALLRALGVHSQLEALAEARRLGLLP